MNAHFLDTFRVENILDLNIVDLDSRSHMVTNDCVDVTGE